MSNAAQYLPAGIKPGELPRKGLLAVIGFEGRKIDGKLFDLPVKISNLASKLVDVETEKNISIRAPQNQMHCVACHVRDAACSCHRTQVPKAEVFIFGEPDADRA